jgi:hypothetical protein
MFKFKDAVEFLNKKELERRKDYEFIDAMEAAEASQCRIADHYTLSNGILLRSFCFSKDEFMPYYGLAITQNGFVKAVEHNNDDIWRLEVSPPMV